MSYKFGSEAWGFNFRPLRGWRPTTYRGPELGVWKKETGELSDRISEDTEIYGWYMTLQDSSMDFSPGTGVHSLNT